MSGSFYFHQHLNCDLTAASAPQNTMPGWDPLSMWNPVPASADPDCKLNPMYQERGMGYGASYGGSY